MVMTMSNLPRVPWLEEVNNFPLRNIRLLTLWLLVGEMIIFAPVAMLVFNSSLRGMTHPAWFLTIAIPVICVTSPIIVLAIMFTKISYWRTDSDGLTRMTMPGLHRKIAWEDVREVKTTWNTSVSLSYPIYCLRTKRGKLTVPGLLPSTAASIYMHLLPLGTAGGLQLTPDMQSFWLDIPNAIPAEMDWDKIGATGSGGVQRVELRSDGVTVVKNNKQTFILWSSITKATYVWGSVRLTADGKQTVVPFAKGDPASARLILALIRRLRTLERPLAVVIPEAVRATAGIQLGDITPSAY